MQAPRIALVAGLAMVTWWGAGCSATQQSRPPKSGHGPVESQAVRQLREGCDKGDLGQCGRLADMYRTGNGVAAIDMRQAAQLYQRVCQGRAPMGCVMLGRLYERGDGVPQDRQKAAALHDIGCRAGAMLGCTSLGLLVLGGAVPMTDAEKGKVLIGLFSKACAGGEGFACYYLADLNVPKGRKASAADLRRARALYGRACQAGVREGCTQLEKLGH